MEIKPETIQVVTPIADAEAACAEKLIRVPDEKKRVLEKIKHGKDGRLVSKSADVKESYFRAYSMAGGLQRLVCLIEQKKQGKSKESRAKASLADKRFLEYCYRVLPSLFPKKTELEVEHRSVIFVFGDGRKEIFESEVSMADNAIDAEVEG